MRLQLRSGGAAGVHTGRVSLKRPGHDETTIVYVDLPYQPTLTAAEARAVGRLLISAAEIADVENEERPTQ